MYTGGAHCQTLGGIDNYLWERKVAEMRWVLYCDALLDRLSPRNNILDPDFFLRSDNVLKFRIFWSGLVTAYFINPLNL